jgi:hypothetical protein
MDAARSARSKISLRRSYSPIANMLAVRHEGVIERALKLQHAVLKVRDLV